MTAPSPDGCGEGVSPETIESYQLAQYVLKLARSQMLLEQRLHGRLGDIEGRLETVETALGDTGRLVTGDQAATISQAVKAVALHYFWIKKFGF